jgi:hypothetical protein
MGGGEGGDEPTILVGPELEAKLQATSGRVFKAPPGALSALIPFVGNKARFPPWVQRALVQYLRTTRDSYVWHKDEWVVPFDLYATATVDEDGRETWVLSEHGYCALISAIKNRSRQNRDGNRFRFGIGKITLKMLKAECLRELEVDVPLEDAAAGVFTFVLMTHVSYEDIKNREHLYDIKYNAKSLAGHLSRDCDWLSLSLLGDVTQGALTLYDTEKGEHLRDLAKAMLEFRLDKDAWYNSKAASRYNWHKFYYEQVYETSW